MEEISWVPEGAHLPLVERAFGEPRRALLVPFGERGRCYWNADAYAAKVAGTVRHSWEIYEWPTLYIVGLHHAVVELADGSLVDPTRAAKESQSHSTVVMDESVTATRDYPNFIPKRFVPIINCGAVRLIMSASKRQEDAQRRQMQELRRQGVKFSFSGISVEPTPEFLASTNEYEQSRRDIDAARAACVRMTRKNQAR